MGWASLFIWGAAVLVAEATGVREQLLLLDGWSVFFTGAGAIVLFEAFIRMIVPGTRHLLAWNLIGGSVLICIGLGDELGWALAGASILATFGFLIALGTLFGRRESSRES
ncbi:MAG: hypothetical protein ACYTFG_15735 [Planctomycetota bacterium]|jgi:hypothetical protein